MSLRRAFTVIELLVVIGIIAVLIGILIPVIERVRHKGYIDVCASNLRQIGQAMAMYANDNHNALPRTNYDPNVGVVYGTGINTPATFSPAGPASNDISAAMFLLMKVQKLPPVMMICPYNDLTTFESDKGDVPSRSNFTDYRRNLGYSLANPYPDNAAVLAGYKWTSRLPGDFAIAADRNPNKPDVKSNSKNHEWEGENVLYSDGHVTYQLTPLCGLNRDNIYTSQSPGQDSPANRDDSVLLPKD